MIPDTNNTPIKTDCQNSTLFTIDEEDMAFIFSILRNNMYSDAVKIVVQEYLCNARDAHREAKTAGKQPEVWLPTYGEGCSEFVVRDFGSGLTYEQMVNVFCKYGKSTKRGTNQTGGFGIGAKSAWAYGNEFFVESVVDGEKSHYHLYIDDSDRGKMDPVATVETDEPNGLLVRVPVQPDDYYMFGVHFANITRYWGMRPKLMRGTAEYPTEEKVAVEGEDWILYERGQGIDGKPKIIVDDIPYPLDESAFSNELTDEISSLFSKAWHLFVKTDEVNVAANREGLTYTKTTVSKIITKAKETVSFIERYVYSELSKEKNLRDARILWAKDEFRYVASVAPDNITWNGFSIQPENCTLRTVDFEKVFTEDEQKLFKPYEVYINRYNCKERVTKNSFTRFYWDDVTIPLIFVDDTTSFPREKIRQFINTHKVPGKDGVEKSVYRVKVILPKENKTEEVKNLFEKKLQLFQCGVYLTSEMGNAPKRVIPKSTSEGNACNVTEVSIRWSENSYDKQAAYICDLEGYFLYSKRKDYNWKGEFCSKDSQKLNKACELIGIEKVWFIPERFAEDVEKNKNLIQLDKAILPYEDEIDFEELTTYSNRMGLRSFVFDCMFYNNLRTVVTEMELSDDSLLNEYKEESEKISFDNDRELDKKLDYAKVCMGFTLEMNSKKNRIQELYELVKETYKMLFLLNYYTVGYNKETIQEYIQMMDELRRRTN